MIKSNKRKVLIEGRHQAPLSKAEVIRATNTFIGLDRTVNARYEEGTTTRFAVTHDEQGQEFGEIIFSNDIFPGQNIVNPNAALSLDGAAAHELAHYYRWRDKSELEHGVLTHIDEAMTSLEASLRFANPLNDTDIQGLISDALHRLRLYVETQTNGNMLKPAVLPDED